MKIGTDFNLWVILVLIPQQKPSKGSIKEECFQNTLLKNVKYEWNSLQA